MNFSNPHSPLGMGIGEQKNPRLGIGAGSEIGLKFGDQGQG